MAEFPANEEHFFTEDMLTCLIKKSTGVNNDVIDPTSKESVTYFKIFIIQPLKGPMIHKRNVHFHSKSFSCGLRPRDSYLSVPNSMVPPTQATTNTQGSNIFYTHSTIKAQYLVRCIAV